MTIPDGKEVYTMYCDCHGPVNKLNGTASPRTSQRHEEVDTRLTFHALDTNMSGHKQIKIRSNDTEVVHLAILVVN